MQLIQSRQNFIEKIIRDTSGRLARVTFCVYENGSSIKARVVNIEYLEENISLSNKTLCLVGSQPIHIYQPFVFVGQPIISPFVNLYSLSFLGSKPRAPTFA